MFRPVLLAAGLAFPLSAQAQDLESWLEVLNPDLILESMVQSGVIALRTQVDLVYGELTLHTLAGQAVITDLELWPILPWSSETGCNIKVDRLVLAVTRPGLVEDLHFDATAYGVTAQPGCLPPDVTPVLALTGLETVTVPAMEFSMAYNVPSSGLDVHLSATLDGIAAVDLDVEFDYVALDGRLDMDDPQPYAFLNGAKLSVQNLGGWEVAQGFVPPPFTNPEQMPNALGGMVGAALASMNRDAAPVDATGDPSALNGAQERFVSSAIDTWSAFLAAPNRLVLETGIKIDESLYVDFEGYEKDPKRAFADLGPIFSAAPASARAALPVSLIQAALTPESTISAEERLAVGRALITGEGAPRHIAHGIDILVPLAQEGEGRAADALAAALEDRQPENAYGWGLLAGAAGVKGATARLDRLEREIPFARILEIQSEVNSGANHPAEALENMTTLKTQARARLTGKGAARSYEIAALWAILAKATGDVEAGAILEEIDARVQAGGAEAIAAWDPVESAASTLALDAWLGRNLAAQYGAE